MVWSMLQRKGKEGVPLSQSLPLLLHEKSTRAAGGTQCVAVFLDHVVCVSEERASGTSMESRWCRWSLVGMRLRGYSTLGSSDK